jgi:hypothetical protein
MLHRIALPVVSEWCQTVVFTISYPFAIDARVGTGCPHLAGFTLGYFPHLRQLGVEGVILALRFSTCARGTVE